MAKPGDQIEALYPTLIYHADKAGPVSLNHALAEIAWQLAREDVEGQRWCAKHGYPGYTSYASIDDLAEGFPAYARLEAIIARHAARFAKHLHWDLRGGRPVCDSIWVNILPEGGSHTSHLHTNAVMSGTYYVLVPEGSGALVFEDPRHAMLMAAPPRKTQAPRAMQTYVSVEPKAGTLLLWESWLRHEVAINRASAARISVSFNLVIGQ
jgi:uncharacterized protein (TIGR02466 family)